MLIISSRGRFRGLQMFMKCRHFVPRVTYQKEVDMRLRRHQQELADTLDRIVANELEVSSIIMRVTPGGGKSMLPQIVAKKLIPAGLIDRVCCIVPRLNLKSQMAEDFVDPRSRECIQHTYEINEASNDYDASRGTAGYVSTYQAIASDAVGLNEDEFKRFDYALILDEAHHVGVSGSYHQYLQPLVDASVLVILMTGTLSRHDKKPIAFVPYEEYRHAAS
jgi:superfamily II DNA or RNA helicase